MSSTVALVTRGPKSGFGPPQSKGDWEETFAEWASPDSSPESWSVQF